MIFSISITFRILVIIIIIIIIIIITVKWNPLFHYIFEMYYVHSFTDDPISLLITCIFKSIQKMSSIHNSLYYIYIYVYVYSFTIPSSTIQLIYLLVFIQLYLFLWFASTTKFYIHHWITLEYLNLSILFINHSFFIYIINNTTDWNNLA